MDERARPGRRRALLLAAVTVVVAGLAGSGLAGAGGGTFTDVTPDHLFYEEIEAIADAGITTGFPDDTYRPNGTVSRGAMAAFMGRGFGRGGVGVSSFTASTNDGEDLGAFMSLTSGAASGEGGYVMITATAEMEAVVGSCPCGLRVRVRNVTNSAESQTRADTTDVALPGSALATTSVSTQGRFAIPANTTHQYRVVVELLTNTGTNANVQTHIQGTYVPFDGTGNAP